MQEGRARARRRAVLDSNVIISGLVFEKGNPARVLEALRTGEIEAVISPHILDEISRSFREDFDWNEARVLEAVRLLRQLCTVIDPPIEAAVSDLTPADNRMLDCAVHGQVEYLVTGDRGILRLAKFEGIEIVAPAQFVFSGTHRIPHGGGLYSHVA